MEKNIKKTTLTFTNLVKRRKTTEIIIHCSATKEGVNVPVTSIHRMHRSKGWSGIGYHFYIDINGNVWEGRPEDCVGAHATGHNDRAIGICYCGGVDANGRPKDTRTYAQEYSLNHLVAWLCKKYPDAKVSGHRQWANKACPCFDAAAWADTMGFPSDHTVCKV